MRIARCAFTRSPSIASRSKMLCGWLDHGEVAQPVRLRVGTQFPERIVLDLADPLPCDVERSADLVERLRRFPAQPVPQLEHAPLALAKRAEHARQNLVA